MWVAKRFRYRFAVLLLFCTFILASTILVRGWSLAKDSSTESVSAPAGLSLAKSESFSGATKHELVKDGGLLIKTRGGRPVCFVVPIGKRFKGKKLQFSLEDVKNFRYFAVHFSRDLQPYAISPFAVLSMDVPGKSSVAPTFYTRIPAGNISSIQLTFVSRNAPAEMILKSIKICPLDFRDGKVWPYVLAFGIGVMLLLPGMLLFVLLHRRPSSETFLLSIFLYSLFFYFVAYLVLVAAFVCRVPVFRAHIYMIIFSLFALFLVLFGVSKKRVWRNLGDLLWTSWREFAAYAFLLVALCFIITHNTNLPLQNMYYRDIAGSKTFNAFHAHDGIFQYVNGLAIADNEPFSKYYAHRQLIYNVEDREILPGVVYGVFRALLVPWLGWVGKSYFVYTLLGIAMNLMLVFPAAALARRFLGIGNTFLLILLLSANAYMVGNYLLTWFKLAGAALFLSGLYFMLKEKTDWGDWPKSGLYFGLGANMHAGAALGIPLFFLWAVWRGFHGRLSIRSFLGPLLLVLVFAATIAPWSTVKHLYLHENYSLIKSHFLGGYSSPKGLGASAQLFFENTPIEKQISTRLGQLATAFRFEKLSQLQKKLHTEGGTVFLGQWNTDEFNFLVFSLYPGALFALFVWMYARFIKKQPGDRGTSPAMSGKVILTLSLLTMVTVILAHFGKHPPDIVYHQPLAVLFLADMVLVAYILKAALPVRIVYFGYMAFVVYRLALFL